MPCLQYRSPIAMPLPVQVKRKLQKQAHCPGRYPSIPRTRGISASIMTDIISHASILKARISTGRPSSVQGQDTFPSRRGLAKSV